MYGSFVVPTTLASSTDYTNWTQGAAPSNITAVLRGCSGIVLEATVTAIYDADPTTGLATDPVILAALRDATCIQAQAWVTLNIDPATGGVMQSGKGVKLKKLATAFIEYSDAELAAQAEARAAAYKGLVPAAARYLQQRNLLSPTPWIVG